jgi:hypothetical protein
MGISLAKRKARLEARIKAHDAMVKRDSGGSGKCYTRPGSMKK